MTDKLVTYKRRNYGFINLTEFPIRFRSIGIEACERVLDTENADLHKWYALLLGSRIEYLPIKEKLENGMRFEKHVKKALSLRASDPTLHYLLGRFKYSVSGLGWIEKKVRSNLGHIHSFILRGIKHMK